MLSCLRSSPPTCMCRYNFKLNSLLYSKTHAQVYEVSSRPSQPPSHRSTQKQPSTHAPILSSTPLSSVTRLLSTCPHGPPCLAGLQVLDPRRRVDMGGMEEDEEDLPGGGHKDQVRIKY